MDILLGVSNRHVHLNEEDYQILFGNTSLEVKKSLVQPGEFASNLVVTIKTEKNSIENVRILGPIRKYTQVELSKTDAYQLGINPPVRDSGDLTKAQMVEIIGLNGSIKKECAILATRHIHMTKNDRIALNLEDKDEVSIEIQGEKGAILHHVKIKEGQNYALECHLDTDDANALLAKTGDFIKIIY